jgi:DNA-binding Lrp family transcriptional regulator
MIREMKQDVIFPTKLLYDRKEEKAQKIIKVMEQNCRAPLTDVADQTGIPLSTVFKIVEKIKKHHTFRLEMVPTRKKIYGTPRMEEKLQKIIKCLNQDPRMTLTEMSKQIRIPVSTIFDNLKTLETGYQLKIKLLGKSYKDELLTKPP